MTSNTAPIEASALTDDEQEALLEAAKLEQKQKEELLESLAMSITSKFISRAAKRAAKESQWLRSAALYYGKLGIGVYNHNGETPYQKTEYVNRPDINVVRSKCSIAIAQSVSMQFGTSNKNWDLWPPKGNQDPQVEASCAAMSDEIEQQLETAKYSLNCRRSMWDRVVLGTGVLKGPNSEGRLTRSYKKIGDSSTWEPSVTVDYAPVIKRINPWFFYPDETVEDTEHLGDTIEIHTSSALDLKKLMGHEGFIASNIAKVLERKPEEYTTQNWADFAKLSENNPNLYKNKYVLMEYHGPITQTQLNQLSIEPCYESVNQEYYGEVWVCQGEVIRLELEAIEASFAVPYYISVWEKDPGSVFGYGVPLMMEDAQRVVNESWHMILDNTSLSSGPMAAMQKGLIEPANGKWEMGPRQIWYLQEPQAKIQDAIQFFDVPNVSQNIVPILEMAMGFSEQESGIPLISAGLQSPQTEQTATGGLIMDQASTTLLDFMSEEWDDNVTEPIIKNMYAWNMQNSLKPEIKGSYCVDVRTSTQYKNKQLHIRDLEKLSVESIQNPNMAKIINQDALTRMRLDMMSLPSKSVIKTDEEIQKDEEAEAAKGPSPEMMELQLKARKQSLEEAQLAFQMKQEQQRAIWEHEEKLQAIQARLVEAQARVAVSQNDKETEMLKISQKGDLELKKIMSNESINTENNQTKAFITGLQEARQRQEAATYEKEVAIQANQKGKDSGK